MENYRQTLPLAAAGDKVFKALTEKIPLWWTATIDGAASQVGHIFTVRFGKDVCKSIRIEHISSPTKVVWKAMDSLIAVPGLKNQTEWTGTTIVWELTPGEKSTDLQLTHIGLHAGFECHEICIAGWKQFTDSLKLFVETGEGLPFRP